MKFEYITANGTAFMYDNSDNSLYQPNGVKLSKDLQTTDDIDYNRFGRTTLDKDIETLKITLGHGCNYSCDYCLQKDIGNPDERPKNGLTDILISKIKRHIKFDRLNRIELWGGETLLYWNDIVLIMLALDSEKITWYIPTNGTPLMNKHVDFFLQLKGKVTIGISHDGPAHEHLRGREFLHKKVDVLRRIQLEGKGKIAFSFNTVISKHNYDLFKINDFFTNFLKDNNLERVGLTFELARVYDQTLTENSTLHVITSEKEEYRKILYRYLKQCEYEYKNKIADGLLVNSLFHYGFGVLEYARSLAESKVLLRKSNCGADDAKLMSIDMNGNIKSCQNVSDSHIGGNIIDIKGAKVIKIAIDRPEKGCSSCANYVLCRSSCPLDLGYEVFKINCNIEKAHYSTMQKVAFEFIFNDKLM